MPPMRRLSSAAVFLTVIASMESVLAGPTTPAVAPANPGLTTNAVEPDAATRLAAAAPRANPKVLALAVQAADCARRQGQSAVARLAVHAREQKVQTA